VGAPAHAELGLLLGIWTTVVREARPHLVSLLGEPGVGKSRLVAEFERRAGAVGDAALLHGRCLPYGATVGYRALAMALREAANVAAEDGAEAARRKLGDLVGAVMGAELDEADRRQTERHLALLSGLDSAADRAGASADERVVRVSAWRFLERLAGRQPLCILIEDLHWADEALLNMLEFVAARARAVPLLVITQARPAACAPSPRSRSSRSTERPASSSPGRCAASAGCRSRSPSRSSTRPAATRCSPKS
jgi:predicted ATPase